MLPLIKKLYRKTELKKVDNTFTDENFPDTWIKIFYKKYPRFRFVSLVDDEFTEFDTLLSLRESSRYFSDKPVSFIDISRILSSCKIVDTPRDPEKRTYPSGGARFPVDMYLVVNNVNELERGAYHYNMKKYGLELLLQEDLRTLSRDLISPYLENPAATIIFTSVISRSEIKYGYKAF